jgi:hypothetical protein
MNGCGVSGSPTGRAASLRIVARGCKPSMDGAGKQDYVIDPIPY